MDEVLDTEPGTDPSVPAGPVVFKPWLETGAVVEVTNVLGKPVAPSTVELTGTLISTVAPEVYG